MAKPFEIRQRFLPVVSLSAEYLVMGNLLKRNILTYKAPPNNQGYDLICIHPEPKKSRKVLRIQVKSRYQTDCNWDFPVYKKSFSAFDYLIVVFLNIGNFYGKMKVREGAQAPEFYVLSKNFIKKHHHVSKSGWEKVAILKEKLVKCKNEKGFEIIAKKLGVEYPKK